MARRGGAAPGSQTKDSQLADNSKTKPCPLRVWVLTDGKIGDDVQCLAIAGGLAAKFEKRTINPRVFWAWMAPWGPIDPRDRPSAKGSPLAPPFPDVLVVSGRRAIPYARKVKRASGGKTFVAIMKDPRISPRGVDMIWTPKHDKLVGDKILSTLTSPHQLTGKIKVARENPSPQIAALKKPMLGVVLGGPSGGAKYDLQTCQDLVQKIEAARKGFASIAITPSRRTPPEFMAAIDSALKAPDVFVWGGKGHNPYVDILAQSKALIVAGDSHNMVSESVSSQTGVYVWRPPGMAKKLAWFLDELEELAAVRPFNGEAKPYLSAPIDATGEIVKEIKVRLAEQR